MTLFYVLLLSAFAAAQDSCVTWPTIAANGGPRLAATGMPFTNTVRFNCALGERYSATAFEGQYRMREEKIAPAKALTTYTLPSGEILYQALFSVSNQAVAGVYSFDGCVRVRDKQNGASVCVKLPLRSLEIVRTE